MDLQTGLEDLTHGSTWQIRRSAALALGELGDRRAVESLIQALADDHVLVQHAATIALGKIGDARAVEPLINSLNHSDTLVACAVVEALDIIGGARAMECVIKTLNSHKKAEVRHAAISALAAKNDTGMMKYFIEALKDEDADIRASAVQALDKLGWKPSSDSEQLAYLFANPLSYNSREVFAKTHSLEPFIEASKDNGSWKQVIAVEVLGQVGSERATDTLIQILQDTKAPCREAAARALGNIGGERAIATLIQVLQDTKASVQEAAADALGSIGNPIALKHLKRIMQFEHMDAAALAYWRIRGARSPSLDSYEAGYDGSKRKFYEGIDEEEHIAFWSKAVKGWKERIEELQRLLESNESRSREWTQTKEGELRQAREQLRRASIELQKELNLNRRAPT